MNRKRSHIVESQAIQAALAGTNINAKSMLATDYLNHYNEVMMILCNAVRSSSFFPGTVLT